MRRTTSSSFRTGGLLAIFICLGSCRPFRNCRPSRGLLGEIQIRRGFAAISCAAIARISAEDRTTRGLVVDLEHRQLHRDEDDAAAGFGPFNPGCSGTRVLTRWVHLIATPLGARHRYALRHSQRSLVGSPEGCSDPSRSRACRHAPAFAIRHPARSLSSFTSSSRLAIAWATKRLADAYRTYWTVTQGKKGFALASFLPLGRVLRPGRASRPSSGNGRPTCELLTPRLRPRRRGRGRRDRSRRGARRAPRLSPPRRRRTCRG